MIISVVPLISYLNDCVHLAPNFEKIALLRVISYLEKQERKGTLEVDSFALLKKIARTGLKKSAQEVKLFYKVLPAFGKINLKEQLELKHAVKLAKANTVSSKPAQIVDRSMFTRKCQFLLEKGKGKSVLALHLMLCSGKRRRDISRLTSEKTLYSGQNVFRCTLPYDKTHFGSVTFALDLNNCPDGWSLYSPGELAASLSVLLESDPEPFKFLRNESISRDWGFRSHSLRSVVALYLSFSGASDQEIMNKIGWASRSSLERYRRGSLSDWRIFGSVDEIITVINGGLL